MDFSELMLSIIPIEKRCKDSKTDLSYIKSFSKIFDLLDESFEKLSSMASSWIFSANWVLKEDEFNQKKSYFDHYKEKNLHLIHEIEKMRKQKKKIGGKKIERLERVSKFNLFP